MDEDQLATYLERNGENLAEAIILDEDDPKQYFKRLKTNIIEDGAKHMVVNHQAFLKIIKDCENFETNAVEEALSTLYECVPTLIRELETRGGVKNLGEDERKVIICSCATLFFLIYRSIVEIENKLTKESSNATFVAESPQRGPTKGKKKRVGKLVAVNESKFSFWTSKWRKKICRQLAKLVEFPVYELHHDTPDYLKCCTVTCFLLLRSLPNIIVKDAEFSDVIIRILGNLASKYNEQDNILSRLIPLINTEESAKLVANILNSLEVDFDLNIIPKAVQLTLSHFLAQLKNAANKKLNFGEKGYATFLTELLDLNIAKIQECLPLLFHFIDTDSSTMRSAIVVIFCELICEQDDNETDEKKLKWRVNILNEISSHLRDTNSLVRNKVLQMTSKMIASDKIRLVELIPFVDITSHRVLDKVPTTRKNAISLVREIINKHPLVIKFGEKEYKEKIDSLKEELVQLITQQARGKGESAVLRAIVKEFINLTTASKYLVIDTSILPEETEACTLLVANHLQEKNYWAACEVFLATMKKSLPADEELDVKNAANEQIFLTFFKVALNVTNFGDEDEVEDEFVQAADRIESEDVKHKRTMIIYFQNCQKLGHQIHEIHGKLNRLMRIGVESDKAEVLSFYATIGQSGYDASDEVILEIIDTMSSIDKKTCDWPTLCTIFEEIFFGEKERDDLGITKKMIKIVTTLPHNRRIEMSGIIEELHNRGTMKNLVDFLWDAFCLKNTIWTNENSKSSIFLIGMLSKYNEQLIRSNIDLILDIGFGDRVKKDFELAVSTIEAINCVLYKKDKDGENVLVVPSYLKLPQSHDLFARLKNLILYGLKEVDGDQPLENYSHMVFKIMHFIYTISGDPKPFVIGLLKDVRVVAFEKNSDSNIKRSELLLVRYFNVVNSIVSSHVFYCETVLIPEIKRRKILCHENEQKLRAKKRAEMAKALGKETNANSEAVLSRQEKQDEEFALMTGQTGTDFEGDAIRRYVENLMTQEMFKFYTNQVLFWCRSFKKINSELFRVTIIQCLSNIMLVGATSTSKLITPFTTLWEIVGVEYKVHMIRAATVLTARYPNQMEAVNSLVLKEFRQTDELIRKAALEYMSFLALGEYVKVREQLTEISLCTVDESHCIKESARDFIRKTADKENMLNNALPDIISRLSLREDVSQLKYQEVMKFLLSVAKKERLMVGGLTEKLIMRFKFAKSARECQDLAFCLTHMNFNEKSYKILRDNFKCYAEKLYEPAVAECFDGIIATMKKNSKEEYTQRIEELARDILNAKEKYGNQERIERNAREKDKRRGFIDNTDSESSEDEEAAERRASRAAANASRLSTSRRSLNQSLRRSFTSAPPSAARRKSNAENAVGKKTRNTSRVVVEESDSSLSELEEDDDDGDDEMMETSTRFVTVSSKGKRSSAESSKNERKPLNERNSFIVPESDSEEEDISLSEAMRSENEEDSEDEAEVTIQEAKDPKGKGKPGKKIVIESSSEEEDEEEEKDAEMESD